MDELTERYTNARRHASRLETWVELLVFLLALSLLLNVLLGAWLRDARRRLRNTKIDAEELLRP